MDNIFTTIREHMPVLDSNGAQVGIVDRLESDRIKLTKDNYNNHHWIPLEWIDRVDENVHLNAPGDQVRRQWQEE